MKIFERKLRIYNLNLINFCNFAGDFEMPVLDACPVKPEKLVPFHKVIHSKDSANHMNEYVHFFLDDYQFERFWNAPERYLTCLSHYGGVLAPDFSLYVDMPKAMQIWNTYRNRLLGAWLQNNGKYVIPTVSWSDFDSYAFCFDGLPTGGTFALSTIGTQKSSQSKYFFEQGYEQFVKCCKPDAIIVYGQQVEVIDNTPEITVRYFENDNIKRLRTYGR